VPYTGVRKIKLTEGPLHKVSKDFSMKSRVNPPFEVRFSTSDAAVVDVSCIAVYVLAKSPATFSKVVEAFVHLGKIGNFNKFRRISFRPTYTFYGMVGRDVAPRNIFTEELFHSQILEFDDVASPVTAY